MPIMLEFSTIPYPGLRPFRYDESDIFFGRETQTDQLLSRLAHNRFLAVTGPSGCGKSSLVKAGMIPALRAGFMVEAGSRWRICELRPGDRPLGRLARALALPDILGDDRTDDGSVALIQATLRRGPLGLIEIVRGAEALKGATLLVMIDQFEEVFRYRERIAADEADAFVALLLASAGQSEVPIYVVITMRSDYLGECAVFHGLPEAVSESPGPWGVDESLDPASDEFKQAVEQRVSELKKQVADFGEKYEACEKWAENHAEPVPGDGGSRGDLALPQPELAADRPCPHPGAPAALGTAGNQFFNQLWQQAAAQGMSVFLSSGDSGSAGCDRDNPAQFGLQVSGFASTPYTTTVGGTDFNDLNNFTPFWNLTNDAHEASAKSYIPEMTWNDSCTNAEWSIVTGITNAETNCNNGRLFGAVVATGGSGGKSSCTTGSGQDIVSCTGGYPKPSWQSGTGVPNDGKRDIPDVSLFASNGFNGNFYVICSKNVTNSYCDPADPNGTIVGIGGTSASTPAFAGIMALIDQKTNSRQGNPNYVLYSLAAKQPASGCNSSSAIAIRASFRRLPMAMALARPIVDRPSVDLLPLAGCVSCGDPLGRSSLLLGHNQLRDADLFSLYQPNDASSEIATCPIYARTH